MIDQDSAEFTEAFVSAVRPGEPRGRPLWWMAMIAIGVVFAAALASLAERGLRRREPEHRGAEHGEHVDRGRRA